MEDSVEDQIASLRSELKTYGADIMNQISALYSTNQSSVDLKNDPRNMLKILKHDISQLLQEVQSESEYNETNMSAIMECESLAAVLDSVSVASIAMTQCSEKIMGADIMAASAAILEIDICIKSIPGENTAYGSGAVCDMLRREARLLRTRFTSRLTTLLQDCIHISRGRIFVSRELTGVLRSEDSLLSSAVALADVWGALAALADNGKTLGAVVGYIVGDVWRDVISPLWREKKPHTAKIVSEGRSAELCIDLPNTDGPSDSENAEGAMPSPHALPHCRMKFPQLLDAVGQLAGFLYAEVFCANDKVLAVARKVFSDGLSGSVSSRIPSIMQTLCGTLTCLIPKLEDDLEPFQTSVQQSCADFEKKLELFGLFESAGGGGGPLMIAAREIPTRFLEARRLEVLSRARSVVLGDYHNTMLGTGNALEDDPATAGSIGDSRAMLEQSGTSFSLHALPFEPCQVSLAACRLLKLIHEVLKQACAAKSPQLVALLYQSGRDCLEIFAAVVQSKFADIINTVPRMGAVFYNDCCYIAHNATLISHQYRQGICEANPGLQDCVGFVDFIPRFRAMGERSLQVHIEEQKRTLLVLLGKVRIHIDDEDADSAQDIDEFGGSSGISGGEVCNSEEAATLLVKHMGRLKGQWQNVLQESVYERLAGYLLEVVLRRAMRPVLAAKFVSERAATDVSRVFKAVQKGREVLLGGGTDQRMTSLVGSWGKFCALTDLLEYSLSDIAEWLPRRKFAEFTGSEMSLLVKALFEDSHRRQAILASILEMSS